MELIRTEKLVKSYHGRRVVDGVNLAVRPGEVVGLLGPNGAGKTTTFYMIVGMIRPSHGRVFFEKRNITRLPMYRRARMGIGYLCQEPSVFRRLTVEQNIMAILETLPLGRRERRERLQNLLDELGLAPLARHRAYTLSGGERRRLEITRALVTSPRFLLLDEPFSGVDPIAVHDVQQIIAGLRERGLGLLITDHNARETLKIVDRAYLIREGRVLAEGSSDYLINDQDARRFYLGWDFTM